MQIKDSIDMNKIVYIAILFCGKCIMFVSLLATVKKMDFGNDSNGYGQLNSFLTEFGCRCKGCSVKSCCYLSRYK